MVTSPGDARLLGQTLAGRWQLVDKIGDGGMGIVFRGRAVGTADMVAIKVLAEHLARDPSWVRRFENEARAIEQLTHPNTVRLLGHGKSDEGRLYLVMELLSGRSLREVLEREGPLPAERVLRLLMEACPALAEAHDKGIFHRDLKPDNLFVRPGDKVKILDFSVAKLRGPEAGLATAAGIIFGTPQYMAPEQGRGFVVDARSDLYSLGMIAYELLVGRVPFHDADPMTVLALQVRAALPAMANVPAPMIELVEKLCAKDPLSRFQSARELEAACRQVLRESLRRPGAAPGPAPTLGPGSGLPLGNTVALAGTGSPSGPATPPAAAPPGAAAPPVAGVPPLGKPGARASPTPATPSATDSLRRGAAPSALHGAAIWIACIGGGALLGVAAYWLVARFG